MTEDELIALGHRAEAFLNDDIFNELFEFVKTEIANEILATSVAEKDTRDTLFQTYNGMRDFAGRLAQMKHAKDNIMLQREQETLGQSSPDF